MVVVFMLKHAGVLNPNQLVKNLLPEVEEEPAEPYTSDDLEKMFAKMTEEENERYKSAESALLIAWVRVDDDGNEDKVQSSYRAHRFQVDCGV